MRLSLKAKAMEILLSSRRVLYDETVGIRVRGLEPSSRVEIRNDITYAKSGHFNAQASFRADENGNVDVSAQCPLPGGSYQGIDGMGLFSSLTGGQDNRYGARLTPTDARVPLKHTISAWSGSEKLGEASLERLFLSAEVERTEVEDGNIRGAFFAPKGASNCIGIVDMFGTGGGLMEHRAALLASRGFAVLALGIMFYKDRPAALFQPLDLEYILVQGFMLD